MSQKIMDLGDFTPSTWPVRFSIDGNEYQFELTEATVDDVFRLLAEKEDENMVDKIRRAVTEFLVKRAPEDKKEQLREDLAKVPYKNENGMSMLQIYDSIQGTFVKKDLGGEKTPKNPDRSG